MHKTMTYKIFYIKLFILFFIFLVTLTYHLHSSDFQIEKINEFAFAQNFNSGGTLELDFPYIYGITSHGLEIYELNDQSLPEKISNITIRGSWSAIKKKNNFVYIPQSVKLGAYNEIYKLYKINVENPYNPTIVDSLVFNNNKRPAFIDFFGDYLYVNLAVGMLSIESRIYSLPDLELVSTIYPDLFLIKVTDSLAINYTATANVANIYDLRDISNPQYLTQRDFGNLAPDYFQTINDTIVIATNQEKVTIWDISDKANWELVTEYVTQYVLNSSGNNFMRFENYALLISGGYLEVIDISDINSIQPVDTACAYDDCWSAVYYDNYLYVGTGEEGIQRYSFNNNTLDYEDNYFEYPSFCTSYLYGDYLFVQTYHYGIYLFDISNPLEPEQVPTILDDIKYKNLNGKENLIWVQDYSDYSYRIYDITDPLNPQLQNVIPIGDWQQINRSCILFDGDNLNEIYTFYTSPTKLEKYDISEVNNAELLFEYTDIDGGSFVVKDGLGYLTNKVNTVQELYILDGLNENSPFITEYYPGFLPGNRDGYLQLCQNYLCTRNEPTRFYNLDDPLFPDFEFELEDPSFAGPFSYFENYIFTRNLYYKAIYDISNINNTVISPIEILNLITFSGRSQFLQKDNKVYLVAVEYSAIEVFEFPYNNINNNTTDDIISMVIHPNPFSLSTKISFNCKKPLNENNKMEIYNIKGQKVRSLVLNQDEITENGYLSYSVEWDGKNENKQKVASGIYFCKIKTAENTFVSKMLRVE